MYAVTVRRSFIAQHFLTVPNPGPEGELHSHRYRAAVTFEGPDLNEFGYLVDIDAVHAALDTVVDRYADETLNELPAFEGNNPSVERFAAIVSDVVRDHVDAPPADRLRVRVWEDEDASATYETEL